MSIPYTWVYLIWDPATGLYKIGKSDDPDKRLKQLCSTSTILASPPDYQIYEAWCGPETLESTLHEEFAHRRSHGEWFGLTRQHVHDIEVMLAWYRRWNRTGTKAADEARNWHKRFVQQLNWTKELRADIKSLLEQRKYLVRQRDALITFADSGDFDTGQQSDVEVFETVQ